MKLTVNNIPMEVCSFG